MTITIAHVIQQSSGEWSLHTLVDHLDAVAKRSSGNAVHFDAAHWGYLAGLWHDLGKFSPQFQGYIASASGYDTEAHVEGCKGRVDHSTAGAQRAVGQFKALGRPLAYLIAGHHAGLPDWHGDQHAAASLSYRLNQPHHLATLPIVNVPARILDPGIQVTGKTKIPGGSAGAHLWLRMLFSCLVDADFLDTEAFMSPKKAEERGEFASLGELLVRFNAYMTHFDDADPTPVNRLRASVLRQCCEQATLSPGLFTLTVPTGGGKTLASLAFALRHAQQHGKRRVVYAIPYTSIIEQTTDIYRGILGESVVEHHSNLDPDLESAKGRLATENWDAPLVVTTNVQLFESLFAARTSRCRKLHNLVGSVIVLDEAQLLPPELLQPVLDVLNLLTRHYGVSVVLCTATQPALDDVRSFGRASRGLDGVREIMDDPDTLFASLKRVAVRLPSDFQDRRAWSELAIEIAAHDSVLAIVNTRRDCRELYQLMPPGTVHLSASMCGAHRAECIARIKTRLAAKQPTRVVSTQLVEAGVDLDFPVVYRALAGLDSLAQAAGRCNREGHLPAGQLVVFVPPKPAPPGPLRRAEQATISLLSESGLDPLERAMFTRYFQHYYLATPSWDAHGIEDLLTRDAAKLEIQFRTAAERFRFIDDADSQPILVWWGNSQTLIDRLEKMAPERWLMRKLQRSTVNLPRRTVERLVETGEVREIRPGLFAQAVDTLYDTDLGVVTTGALDVAQLII